MVTKVGAARGITAAYLLLRYHKEMQENYRKGDWAEAAKDTAFFAVAVTPVVAPNFFFGTLGPYWIGIGAGVVATGIIVEVTGIGDWQTVRDFALQDPRDMPRDYFETVIPAIKEEIIVPAAEAYVGWVDRRAEEYVGWVDRRVEEFQLVWSLTRPQPLW